MPQRPGPAMAFTCGVAVATIYFIQPLLGAVQHAFPGSPWATLVPTLTQLGYAAGLFTLVPLGDIVDRRKLILAQLAGLSLALLGVAVAPSAGLLGAASLVVGLPRRCGPAGGAPGRQPGDAGATGRGGG